MKKEKILQFISRYNLNGNVEAVKWETTGEDTCRTTFITDDKSVLGQVSVKESFIKNEGEIGVYDTARLKQLLTVVGDDVEVEVTEVNDKNVSIVLSDDNTSVNFMLADLAVIPNVPELKELPPFDVSIPFSNDFAKKFVRSANALSDVDTFTLVPEGDDIKLVIGYSTINSNRISLDVLNEGNGTLTETISFSAKYFKEILVANADAEKSVLNVSSKGISNINFEVGDFQSSYYLVEIKTTD